MALIKKIVRLVNKDSYAVVVVQLEDGSEAEIYVGGGVEVYFDERYGKTKAFVKKSKDA